MLTNDLFNTDHERRLAEGAVDKLEQRRIDDLAMKMDELANRVKSTTDKTHRESLLKAFLKCKEERDSYYKVRNETMGYGSLGEGQMKQEMHKAAERMTLTQFINRYGDEDWIREFWNNINGPIDEGGIPGNVPTEKIPGKEDLLKGRGRSYYEDAESDSMNPNAKCRVCKTPFNKHFNFAPDGKIKSTTVRGPCGRIPKDFPDLYNIEEDDDWMTRNRRFQDRATQDRLDHEDEMQARAFDRGQRRRERMAGSSAAGVDLGRWLKPYQMLEKNNFEPIETKDRFEYLMQVALKLKGTGAGFDGWTGMSTAARLFKLDPREQKLVANLIRNSPRIKDLETYMRDTVEEAGDVQAKTDDALRAYWEKVKREKQAGTTTSVPTEKIPGKADLLKGKGRSYYEGQKKSSKAVAEADDPSGQIAIRDQGLEIPIASKYAGDGQFKITVKNKPAIVTVAGFEIDPIEPGKLDSFYLTDVTTGKTHHVTTGWNDPVATAIFNNLRTNQLPALREIYKQDMAFYDEHDWDGSQPDRLQGLSKSGYNAIPADRFIKGHQDMKKVTGQDLMQENKLSAGDPVVVTGPNEFEGKTGEIYDFSPSGTFVIVDLYNHGKHSMHLSDIAYNEYADREQDDEDDWYDDEEDTLEESDNPKLAAIIKNIQARIPKEAVKRPEIMQRIAQMVQQADPSVQDAVATAQQLVQQYGQVPAPIQTDTSGLRKLKPGETHQGINAYNQALGQAPIYKANEGWQDFNKVEPYAVCLAGKPVKKFDYYEQARRFHDNWKQKLYREGNKEKADKITLMPLNLDEGTRGNAIKQGYQAAVKGLSKQQNPYYKSVNGKTPPAAYDWEAGWEDAKATGKTPQSDVEEAKADPTGSWIVYGGNKVMKFKTHTGAKAYAEKNGGKVASSEFYADKIQKSGVTEGAMSNLHADLADVYRRMAPGIERNRDSFKAGQLYDALEAVAEQHGAEAEFKRMMTGARNRAHMDYDTNPGGFQNWFWYLPFDEEELNEEQDTSAVEAAIIRRIMVAHTDLLMKFGPDKVMQAAEEVAYNVGDVDEIGTSDVSAYVNQVKQILGA
jgi:ribosome modulation factor